MNDIERNVKTEKVELLRKQLSEAIDNTLNKQLQSKYIINKDENIQESQLLRLLCDDWNMRWKTCSYKMNNHYGYNLSFDDIKVIIRRKGIINEGTRKCVYKWATELSTLFINALSEGTAEAFEKFKKHRNKDIQCYDGSRLKVQDRIGIIMLFHVNQPLGSKNVFYRLNQLSNYSCKSLLLNFMDILSAYSRQNKTPAKISSRILKHILDCVGKVYRSEIKDAIITVPANFNPVMCQATRDAAELAGITIRNSDGSERPVLLSEPNAVIYDFINQAKNGEIARQILDLSELKNVVVFDLGGGTLDITFHTIVQRSDYKDALRVNEIATNRYTLLGGDDFDEELAKFMYQRYLNQYKAYPEVIAKIKREEHAVMSQLRTYAEELKLELSSRHSTEYESTGWDDDDSFSVGGNISVTGYAYDDIISTEQLEEVFQKFMGSGLLYMDYKNIDNISNTRNIIYPVLDVLKKASEKLQQNDVKVDAVIMNGGMSRFYMVIDRVKEFFEMDPIIALDPDQAVARGAAVYHYYLHKYEALKDDMRMLGLKSAAEYEAKEDNAMQTLNAKSRNSSILSEKDIQSTMPQIEFGNTILNDSLYMGTKNAVRIAIIPTGAELPYESELMTGFKLTPVTKFFDIPILTRNINNIYQNIARGNMQFTKDYPEGAYITFKLFMSSSKVINMKAWTCCDIEGNEIIEEGQTSITIGKFIHSNNAYTEAMPAISPNTVVKAPKSFNKLPNGPDVANPMLFLRRFKELCIEFQHRGSATDPLKRKKMRTMSKQLANARNGREYANEIIRSLSSKTDIEFVQRLYTIARKNSPLWTDEQKQKLAVQCMSAASL